MPNCRPGRRGVTASRWGARSPGSPARRASGRDGRACAPMWRSALVRAPPHKRKQSRLAERAISGSLGQSAKTLRLAERACFRLARTERKEALPSRSRGPACKLAPMDPNKSTLERAFELAKSGTYANLSELRAAIKAEGYTAAQIEGPALGRQLRRLMDASRAAAAGG